MISAATDNRCHICNRPVDLDESGWLIYWDRKNQRPPTKRVWWQCPDHRPTYQQLQLWGEDERDGEALRNNNQDSNGDAAGRRVAAVRKHTDSARGDGCTRTRRNQAPLREGVHHGRRHRCDRDAAVRPPRQDVRDRVGVHHRYRDGDGVLVPLRGLVTHIASMKYLWPILVCAALAGCAQKVVTKTTTVTHTQTVKVPGPAKKIVHAPPVVHTVTVEKVPPTPPHSKLNPPPAGVYQVGDSTFLVRPGFEANMHYLCSGNYDDGDGVKHNYVNAMGTVNGDFKVDCAYTVGHRYADLPYTPFPLPSPSLAGTRCLPDLRIRQWVCQATGNGNGHTTGPRPSGQGNSNSNRNSRPQTSPGGHH